MQQDRLDQQEEKNNGRRSRKDQEGRDYVCGCGKSYLSYPALYTHIKTKHEGQRPEGTCKVGVVVNKKSTNSNSGNAANTNPVPAANHSIKGANSVSILNTQKSQSVEVLDQNISHPAIKSQLSWVILKSLESLTEYTDFAIISELASSEQFGDKVGFVQPDNRILKQKVGDQIYNAYSQLIKQGKDIQKDQNEEQHNYEPKFKDLGYRNEPQYVMVIYLLGAGRFAGEQLMNIYMEFSKLFLQCFIDHGEQIYQVSYKNNDQQTKQHSRQNIRQRQSPYKYYEYSYAPSSSKSKSYTNYQTAHNSNSPSTPHNNNSSIVISSKQSKYLPLICQFFVKVYISSVYKNQQYKEIIELICADFCGWMYKNKVTVVDVNLNRKYGTKTFNISNEVQDKNAKAAKSTVIKKRQKLKQSPFKVRKNPHKRLDKAASHNMNGSGNVNDNEIVLGQQDIQLGDQSNQQQQDSYKIGHEIVHELGVRDRSGSIQQYINGHQDGIDQIQINDPHHGHDRPIRSNQNINEQQIEQYINS